MTKVKTNRRDGGALALSAILHIAVIAILISQAPPQYVLPEPPAQPMDVQIITAPIIPPPPPIIPPKMTPRKIETAATPPPTPPTPAPTPKPTPTPPEPPKVAPAKPAPPKVSPVVAPPTPPTPPAPRPQPAPKPAAAVAPSPPAPVAAPTKLNIHKPDKDAPADVATLPMAPAPGPARPAAPAAPGASGAPVAGSRLSGLGLSLGAMPSGGSGLRGSLVGCANADSVHLSAVERAHCSERFGVEMNHAPVLDGIPPGKRSAFDRAAEAQEANRREGAIDPMKAMERKHGRSTDFGGGVVTGPASSFSKPDP